MPFPALDPGDVNAFEKALATAERKLAVAAAAEDRALAAERSFESDAALLRSELGRIRDDQKAQLGEICGTFLGEDGQVYPAIPRYAMLDPKARLLGDPCGLMGNGQIYEAVLGMQQAFIDLASAKERRRQLDLEMADMQGRLNAQCARVHQLGELVYNKRTSQIKLRNHINMVDATISMVDRLADYVNNIGGYFSCTGEKCAAAYLFGTIYAAIGANALIAATAGEIAKVALEHAFEIQERDIEFAVLMNDCEEMVIDTRFDILALIRQIPQLELDVARVLRDVQAAASQLQTLHDQAQQLLAGLDESEALSENVQAALIDPNVRIYRDEAVLAADRTFVDAVREAYRSTRVFEYYTSRSYAPRSDLLLLRMATHGADNLQAYLGELENAYAEFEQEFGNPDTRVALISLRDDVVPRLDGNGCSARRPGRRCSGPGCRTWPTSMPGAT